jgi:hypothetical protein
MPPREEYNLTCEVLATLPDAEIPVHNRKTLEDFIPGRKVFCDTSVAVSFPLSEVNDGDWTIDRPPVKSYRYQ